MPLSLLRRLGLVPEAAASSPDDFLDRLEQQLESLPERRASLVAAFAGLLVRVAFADDDISEAETKQIRKLVEERGGLGSAEAELVASIAQSRSLALRGSENHRLTRRFNEVASDEDRVHLIDCLYAVATADDLVSHVEDREVRRIGEALMLPPARVLEIRSRYRDKLEELKLLRRVRGD